MHNPGFSTDGYIIDQDFFSGYPYRSITSDINGCGWIAAYNLRHALGQEADFDAVRREMNGMFRLHIPGPTTLPVMRRYLARHVPGWRYTKGRAAVTTAAARSRAGILRYWEGREPHFVAYIRLPEGHFRFFNVTDGLEDAVFAMEVFIQKRCVRGPVRVFTVE